MEEVYGEKNNRSTRYRDFLWSKSTRFLSHQGQHIPILENEDRQMPHSLSRHCKDFIDSKFDEVMLVIFLLVEERRKFIQNTYHPVVKLFSWFICTVSLNFLQGPNQHRLAYGQLFLLILSHKYTCIFLLVYIVFLIELSCNFCDILCSQH